jgi:hypothetical protein
MQGYLEKLGSNFLVAALIPSLAFVTIAMVIFGPVMPPGLVDRLVSTFNPLNQQGVPLLAFTIILGFSLSCLNTFVYKILEGYSLLARVPGIRWCQRRGARRLKDQLNALEEEIHKLEEQDPDDTRLQELEDLRYYIASELDLRFPPAKQAVLPTRFGNIFRAAETYSVMRYGIDAGRLWPRLVCVIPEEYYEKVEQSNNRLAFVVNCSILALLLGVLCGLAAGYQYLIGRFALLGRDELLYFVPICPSLTKIYFQRALIYLVICAVMIVVSWLMYRASLPIVVQYGNMIRSSFDLFRFDLLRQLNLELPKDSDTEYDLWRKISEFIAIGSRRGPLHFEYQFAADNSDTKASG